MHQQYNSFTYPGFQGRMTRFRVPETKTLGARVAMEILAILLLVYPMLHIYVILQGDMAPIKRGFFCNDNSIKMPNVPEEISVGEAVLIWACVVVFIVPAVEILHLTVFDDTHQQPRVCNIPWTIIELYRILGYCLLGGLCTLLTTEMAKYKIGRHRPYFLTACKIELTDSLCKENGYDKFVTNYTCPGDAHEVREASKSFLSGHSSFSFYCATFLIFYLHARLRTLNFQMKHTGPSSINLVFKALKIFRPFLQFGIFSLAFYISLTRITDYKHHPGDVITGIFVGTFFSILIMKYILDLFKRPRTFKVIENMSSAFDDYDGRDPKRPTEETQLTIMQTRSEPNLRTKSHQKAREDPVVDNLLIQNPANRNRVENRRDNPPV